MTKSIIIVCVLMLLVSCNPKPDDCSTSTEKPLTSTASKEDEKPLATNCTPTENPTDPTDPTEDPTDPTDPSEDVPAEALLFDINVTLTKFDANDEIKVRKAFAIIKKVIATKEFKDRVINFTYGSKNTFVDAEGLSNDQIYQKLLDGSEDLIPGNDHEMNLDLELYYASTSTVGYTYASGLRIWMNTKFFDKYTTSEVAGNVFHEWTHKLGFGHASSYSVSRDSSVPYALGYLIEELGKKYEQSQLNRLNMKGSLIASLHVC